jgi:hypothetical protein
MTTAEELELTIRVATLIKSLSTLIGVKDRRLAKMMLLESGAQYVALHKFVTGDRPVPQHAVQQEES